MNEGWLYAHEYESLNNIYRRLFSANAGLRQARPYTHCNNVRSHVFQHLQMIKQHEKRCEYIYDPLPANRMVSEIQIPRRFSKDAAIIRQCPECAKMVFHSDIYNFPWLKSCPIHNVPLLKQCPLCNLQWPTYSAKSFQMDSQRTCSMCGTIPTSEGNFLARESKAKISEALSPLFQVMDFFLDNKVRMVADGFTCQHGYMLTLDNCNFPEYLNAFNKNYVPSFLVQSNSSLEVIQFKENEEYSSNISRNPFLYLKRLSSDHRNIFTKVARQISNCIQMAAGHNHQLRDKNMRSISRPDCPYCLAFGDWYHYWSYAEGGRCYEEVFGNGATIPAYVVMRDGSYVMLPDNIRLILFELYLHHSFQVIFFYVCQLLLCMPEHFLRRRKKMLYLLSPEIPNLIFDEFLIYKNGGQSFHFVYKRPSPEKNLSLPHGLKTKCIPLSEEFYCYEDTNHGYHLDKARREQEMNRLSFSK